MMGTQKTTPSGCACHPSKGGEYHFFNSPTTQPPRQALLATPPQEGNCLVQTRHNRPVRLRLPPLQRRGIPLFQQPHDTTTPSVHNHPVKLCLPPLHRRGIAWCRHDTIAPSDFACHPSTGEELLGADTTQPPRQAPPATPPQEGNCRVQMRHNRPSVSVLDISPPQEGN